MLPVYIAPEVLPTAQQPKGANRAPRAPGGGPGSKKNLAPGGPKIGQKWPENNPWGGCFFQPILIPTTSCLAGAKYVTKNSTFLIFGQFLGQKMVEKKLRLRGWDLSGEIRAGILRILVLIL